MIEGVAKMDTPSGMQEMVIINESGLYALILGSKLESAKKFKHWVTAEVLPAIRKTGVYALSIPLTEHPGDVAKLINATSRLMERQGSAPHKVTENAQLICNQYGIQLVDDFVKAPEYEQMHLTLE